MDAPEAVFDPQAEAFNSDVELTRKKFGMLEEIVARDEPISVKGAKKTQYQARVDFAVAYRALKPRQREYLQALQQYKWQVPRALQALNNTGVSIDRGAPARWERTDDVFAFVYNALKARARQKAVDKDKLILDAEMIRQDALKKKPILFKGKATGFYENKPDTALRATELLMKTQKMLGNDQEDAVKGTGPPLVIQIVQAETNKVIDVTHGVVIDLPVPSGD